MMSSSKYMYWFHTKLYKLCLVRILFNDKSYPWFHTCWKLHWLISSTFQWSTKSFETFSNGIRLWKKRVYFRATIFHNQFVWKRNRNCQHFIRKYHGKYGDFCTWMTNKSEFAWQHRNTGTKLNERWRDVSVAFLEVAMTHFNKTECHRCWHSAKRTKSCKSISKSI